MWEMRGRHWEINVEMRSVCHHHLAHHICVGGIIYLEQQCILESLNSLLSGNQIVAKYINSIYKYHQMMQQAITVVINPTFL